MVANKPREQRKPVKVVANMHDSDGHSDVTIRNVSRRGLMASCDSPPGRGHYIVLRHGGKIIVGRVVWSNDDAFGVRTQDDIDIESLAGRMAPADLRTTPPVVFRASKSRRLDFGEACEISRRVASGINFLILGIAACATAALVAIEIREVFANPLSQVGQAMAGHSG